jgi:NAD(P)H-dependent FMN reductase
VGPPGRGSPPDATLELVDLAGGELPLLDDTPGYGSYSRTLTNDWSTNIASLDGFVFVTA